MSARSKIDGRDVIYKEEDKIWIFEDTGEEVPKNKFNVFRPAYRELSKEEKDYMGTIKAEASTLLDAIEDYVPDGRYKSLAKTALEESIMWAIKGITE